MSKQTLPCLLVAALTLGPFALPAAAQEEEAAEGGDSALSGTASFGFAATTGNSESSNLNAGLRLNWDKANWTHQFTADAFRSTGQVEGSDEVDTTAERYQLGYQANWRLSDVSYVFGRASFDRDLFSGFERQTSQSVGYGRELVTANRHLLVAEAGAGATQGKRRDGTTFEQFIVRGVLDYAWSFSDTGKFTQRFSVEGGNENTLTESISELRARLVGGVALSLSYIVRNNSSPPAGSVSTDTFTTIGVQYEF